MSVPSDLRARVLELPENARVELLNDLLLSLEPEGPERDPDYEASWAAEIQARSDALHAGKAVLLTREEVEGRIRRRLQQAREERLDAGTRQS